MQKGFSLIEVMIVCALMAILTSFAYASWQHTLVKAHQIDAQQSLYDLAVTLENCYQKKQDYVECAQTMGLSESAHDTLISSQGYFVLSLKQLTSQHYILIAQSLRDPGSLYELDSRGSLSSS